MILFIHNQLIMMVYLICFMRYINNVLVATQTWCTQFFLSGLGYLQLTGGTMTGQLICNESTGNSLIISSGSNSWLFNTYPNLANNPNGVKCLYIRGNNGTWTNILYYFDINGNFSISNNLLLGSYTLTQTILSYLNISSDVQTQLNNKVPISGTTLTGALIFHQVYH